MKKNKWKKIGLLAAVAISGLAISLAHADIENLPFSKQTGNNDGCPGAYTGLVKMTNSSGSLLITPPTNAITGTLTDISGFGSNYVSAAYVMRMSDYVSWCGTNTVTFPATNSDQYCLTIFVKSNPPPPTNGEPVVVQITWH